MIEPSTVLERWLERGFHGGMWIDPPGRVWADFVHDVDELIMVVEGVVELEVGDRRKTLVPGDEVLIPAGTKHTVRNRGSDTARWLYAYGQA